jgi:hypothetical protein
MKPRPNLLCICAMIVALVAVLVVPYYASGCCFSVFRTRPSVMLFEVK